MNKFSEAYAEAKSALDGGKLTGDFAELQGGLKSLLTAATGPDVSYRAKLSELRRAVTKASAAEVKKGTTAPKAHAKAMVTGAGDATKLAERAATLKMLYHLYHQKSSGGQQIWVYSPPSVYTKWIFDEVAGANAATVETVLGKDEGEVYTARQRSIMAQAVQVARAVALAACAKLGKPNARTKRKVRQYFGNSASTDEQLKTVMTTLGDGYKRIANACNGGNIVISDEPIDRNGGGWKDWAFIYTSEAMSVIYLQGAWLNKAGEIKLTNQSPIYRCARTIIHELSHKQVNTEDIVYGPKGLMVDGSAALTPDYALHNADSWAYFAVDVVGVLTGPDKQNGKTACTAILKTPTRTLTTA